MNSRVQEDLSGGKSVSTKLPQVLSEKLEKYVNELGYNSIGEFVRSCIRDKLMFLDERASKRMLDWLIVNQKITIADIQEGLYSISLATHTE